MEYTWMLSAVNSAVTLSVTQTQSVTHELKSIGVVIEWAVFDFWNGACVCTQCLLLMRLLPCAVRFPVCLVWVTFFCECDVIYYQLTFTIMRVPFLSYRSAMKMNMMGRGCSRVEWTEKEAFFIMSWGQMVIVLSYRLRTGTLTPSLLHCSM